MKNKKLINAVREEIKIALQEAKMSNELESLKQEVATALTKLEKKIQANVKNVTLKLSTKIMRQPTVYSRLGVTGLPQTEILVNRVGFGDLKKLLVLYKDLQSKLSFYFYAMSAPSSEFNQQEKSEALKELMDTLKEVKAAA